MKMKTSGKMGMNGSQTGRSGRPAKAKLSSPMMMSPKSMMMSPKDMVLKGPKMYSPPKKKGGY